MDDTTILQYKIDCETASWTINENEKIMPDYVQYKYT